MRVIAEQGDTIDAICWRHFRRTRGLVEAVLELNPGIADHGPILPHGLAVELPEPPNDQPNAPQVNLWD